MWHAPQGLKAFIRGYYHYKSADWKHNRPYPLSSWCAAELAKLPTYYVMPLDKGMAETVASEGPTEPEAATCRWLSDEELHSLFEIVSLLQIVREFANVVCGNILARLAQGGKNADISPPFSNRTIDVPSMFISGSSDWGTYQRPGEFEAMQSRACTHMRHCHLVDGAGHWVQQEQPEQVAELIVGFLAEQTRDRQAAF